jgi:tetratricopeptide (TPR) repeat protein
MSRALWWFRIVVLGLSTFASAAHAQAPGAADEEAARAQFEEGRASFNEGRYEEALAQFESAHRLSGRPALLYNIAQTLDRLSRRAEARDTYRRYLEADPETAQRPAVEARITVLEQDLAAEAERERALAEANRALEEERTRPAEGNEIWEEWWFWTIVGVVVVGGAVGLGVGLGTARRNIQEPLPGDDGLVIETLQAGVTF